MRSNIYTYKEVFDSPGIMFKTEGNVFFFYTVHASIIESHCCKMFSYPKQQLGSMKI